MSQFDRNLFRIDVISSIETFFLEEFGIHLFLHDYFDVKIEEFCRRFSPGFRCSRLCIYLKQIYKIDPPCCFDGKKTINDFLNEYSAIAAEVYRWR